MKHYLDWSSYCDAGMGDAYADIPKHGGDFAKAVAVCINSRQCESDGRGVMCPSYRVSGDANLTPGGRVRLLKRALNSDDAASLCSDAELDATMALCVGCKGCKRECENNVDMAQIKIEYLAQRHACQAPSLRTRLFAHLPRLLHQLPLAGKLIALRNRLPWLTRLGEKLIGISARPLPQPAPHPFTASRHAAPPDQRPSVVLFIDTFTRHFEPANATAALAVLDAAGYQVILAEAPAGSADTRPLCCGRSYLAHGLVEEARSEARRVVEALTPLIDAGHPVIGLEPSCLLALRDDYRSLGLGEAAERVSRNAWLFEEFLARELQAGRAHLAFQPGAQPLLVHGHCHQKAVGAMKAMRKVLNQLPQTEVEWIEASCCGMAGSFGYEAEHHDHSLQMAELALFPALRAQPEAALVANGFSCRQQIREGTAHQPRHLAVVLQERLVK